jgi:two-component system OmpR family sensor kinase
MAYRFGTLRWKLALSNIAIFGVIVNAVCIVVLTVGQNYLRQDFDDWLMSLGVSIAGEIVIPGSLILPEPSRRGPPLPVNPFEFPGLYLQLRLENGTVLERSRTLKNVTLPLSEQAAATRESHTALLQTITGSIADELLGPGRPLRMLTLYHDEPGEIPYYLQVAVSEARLTASLVKLHHLILVLIPIGMVAVGLASWLMARRSLAPIGKIARDLQRLTAADLDRRITVPTEGDELAEIITTGNQMLDRLEAAFRAQEQFIANAAHELKTPVTVLLGEAQVLSRQPRTREQHEHFVNSVQDEMRRFAQLIDSLLTLARADAGFPIPLAVPVSVNEAVTDAVQRCQPLAQRRENRLILTLAPPRPDAPDAVVQGDNELLSLMVANLIRNAIRHSPAGKVVEVEVEVVMRDTEAAIVVRDHGPGIPADLLDRVFDPFFRVPRDTDAGEGAGLGLAIAKGVAELHHGSIHAANRPGGGCEFIVRLPLVSSD